MNINSEFRPLGMEENQFCMLMHLSLLAGYIIPCAGLVLPIIMWATNKEQSKLVDEHGKNILNWIISCAIFLAIGIVLSLILVGLSLIVIVGICNLIFSIIGAIKASEGKIYKYPLAITFVN